jgi:hypothetical protein
VQQEHPVQQHLLGQLVQGSVEVQQGPVGLMLDLMTAANQQEQQLQQQVHLTQVHPTQLARRS